MAHEGVRLGLDFGTSNTVAVLRWQDGRARPLLFDGSPLLPSAVYAEPGGGLIVGRDAIHSARLEPARFEPNPKRRIDDRTVLLGDREFTVVDLITAVLGRVEEERRRTCGDAAVDVTMTCPASWGATRRLVLADAANAAGLGEVRLVAEPIAAATYFTQVLGRDVPIGSAVVVHDFGAGTFDASVVVRTSSGFEVLAVDGRDDIGGLDIDEALVALIGRTCGERDPLTWQRLLQPTTVEERRARRLLWDDARATKERLSRNTAADMTVPLLEAETHITREELEDLARPLLDQTVRVTQSVMRWARLAKGQVAGVFLVGGASRIPLVATLLHRALGEAPFAIEQPELVVAEGSMLAAHHVEPTAAPAPRPAMLPVPGLPAAAVPSLPAPVSGAPVPGTPTSGAPVAAPVSGVPSPVSAAPVSAAPVSGAPVSGALAGGAPRSVGRAAVQSATERPATEWPVDPQPPAARAEIVPYVSRAAAAPRPPQPAMPQPVRSQPVRPQLVRSAAASAQPVRSDPGREQRSRTYRSGPRPFALALSRLFIVVFLAAVPIAAAYIAFKVTVGEPVLPVDLGFFSRIIGVFT